MMLVAVTVEECLEMAGLTTLIYAQMDLLRANSVELRIRFGPSPTG